MSDKSASKLNMNVINKETDTYIIKNDILIESDEEFIDYEDNLIKIETFKPDPYDSDYDGTIFDDLTPENLE